MFKNILVPLDGSKLGEAALPFASAIASRTGASLILVRNARNSSPLGDLTYDQQHETIEHAQEYLAAIAAELTAQGFSIQTGIPYGGSAADWIIEESELRKADLIVMATHDRIGPDRWVHGSVAEAVIHHATLPVMVVRAAMADKFAQRFQAGQPTLVVPLDGSELADGALPVARELARAISAHVVLVGVVPKPGPLVAGLGGAIVTYVGSEATEVEAEARAYLEARVGRVAIGATSVATVVRFGDAAMEIAAAAEEYHAAAIVMATHGRAGVVRSLLGSVAGGVLHHSNGPIMLIHPADLRPAQVPLVQQAAPAV